jgi:hypothetical protein
MMLMAARGVFMDHQRGRGRRAVGRSGTDVSLAGTCRDLTCVGETSE